MKKVKMLIMLILALALVCSALPMSASAASDFVLNEMKTLIGYRGAGGNITIPADVRAIDENVFRDKKDITGVTIGEHVKSIGDFAFDGCINLRTATISSQHIGYSAFGDCENLTTLTLGSTVRGIDQFAFARCYALKSIEIPEGVTDIPHNCFYRCDSAEKITLPKSLKTIGQSAFWGVDVESIYFHKGLESIDDSAFVLTERLKDIWIPETVTMLGDRPFTHTSSEIFRIHGVPGSYAESFFKNTQGYIFVPDYYGSNGKPNDPDDPSDPDDPDDPDDPGEGETGPPKEIRYDDKKGNVTSWNDGTVTVTPKTGYEVGDITVNGKKVTGKKSGDSTVISGVRTTDVIVIDFVEAGAFKDVSYGSYYRDAVNWAVNNKITSGTGNGKFSPDKGCTRAEIVTFLWRMAGKPKVTGTNPFSDVKNGDYFKDAVLWAVKNGITAGTGGGKFSPDKTCTRAQIVTFLWRYYGKPTGMGSFSDVPADEYYAKAVAWAVANNITAGKGNGKFAPNDTCTRGQGMAFLYRADRLGLTPGYGGSTSLPADNDATGYTPKNWTWEREGEGYGLTYFTSGKYVRKDGRAVLYIESSTTADAFEYQLCVVPGGAHQEYSYFPSRDDPTGYAGASVTGIKAKDSTYLLDFSDSGHIITVKQTFIDEELMFYIDAADGEYVLVREK